MPITGIPSGVTLYTSVKEIMMLLLIVALCIGSVAFAGGESLKAGAVKGPVSSPQLASQLAVKYSGLDQLVGPAKLGAATKVELLCHQAIPIPFLRDEKEERTLWKVVFENVVLSLKLYNDSLAQQHPKDFHILLDSLDGSLVQISFSDSLIDISEFPVCPIEEAERQLRKWTEQYWGFPDSRPGKTLAEVLDNNIVASPVAARLVIVHYVEHSHLDHGPTPAWIIHLYGLPPGPSGSTHVRFVCDGVTGKEKFAINVPSCP